MSVLLKSFLLVPRRHSNIAKVAPSARIFIQDERNEGFGKSVLVLEEGRESVGSVGGRYLLQVKEIIMIKKLGPELNGGITSEPLYLF